MLSPEERFRLIFAANGRGDEVEADRLVRSAETKHYSTADYSPYSHAFQELAFVTFMELLEDGAKFEDAMHHYHDDEFLYGTEMEEEVELDDDDVPEEQDDTTVEAEAPTEETRVRAPWERSLEVAYAFGYLFQTKVAGWKLFCERSIPHPTLICARIS